MLNPQTVAKMLGMSKEQSQKLNQAWGQAQQIASRVTTKNEALKTLANSGIGKDFLSKVSSWANNPIASTLAGLAGVDINKIKANLNSLSEQQPSIKKNFPQPRIENNNPNNNSLDKLRNGLQQLKR